MLALTCQLSATPPGELVMQTTFHMVPMFYWFGTWTSESRGLKLEINCKFICPYGIIAVECSDYRTISLMCHTLKLLLTVILKRFTNKIDKEVGCDQAGFRKNSGTRGAIYCLKVITEKYLEMGKELYACFIDYSKAFDTVNHEQLISSLSGTEVDDNDIAVIAHIYWQQITRIRNGSDSK